MVRRQLVGTRRGLIIISTILHQSVLGPGGANCWDASRVDEIVGLNFSLKNPWLQNLRDLMWCAISISKLRLDVKCNARKSFRFFELEWRTSCISNCLIVIFCVAYKPITRIRSFDSCIRSRGRDIRKKTEPSQACRNERMVRIETKLNDDCISIPLNMHKHSSSKSNLLELIETIATPPTYTISQIQSVP